MKRPGIIFAPESTAFQMIMALQTGKKIGIFREILLWIYILFIMAGIIYAAYEGQSVKTAGEILRQKTSYMESDFGRIYKL